MSCCFREFFSLLVSVFRVVGLDFLDRSLLDTFLRAMKLLKEIEAIGSTCAKVLCMAILYTYSQYGVIIS